MCSLAVQRHGSNRPRRFGSSRLLSNALSRSPNSSRETPIAAAETREGRGQKAHAPGRALSNSTKLRNAKAGRVAGRVVSNAKVVSSVKNAKVSAKIRHRKGGSRATLFVYLEHVLTACGVAEKKSLRRNQVKVHIKGK
jgi:hypothetical protein